MRSGCRRWPAPASPSTCAPEPVRFAAWFGVAAALLGATHGAAAEGDLPLLRVPVEGVAVSALHDTFNESRGGRRHEALDIAAQRGTPVVAAADGMLVKLFTSVPGGLTVYQFDTTRTFAYYYAHLDRYADGLREGMPLRRGDVIGYVGSTGNASPAAPHLHFAVFRLGPKREWWKGEAIDPLPLLR